MNNYQEYKDILSTSTYYRSTNETFSKMYLISLLQF